MWTWTIEEKAYHSSVKNSLQDISEALQDKKKPDWEERHFQMVKVYLEKECSINEAIWMAEENVKKLKEYYKTANLNDK